MIRKGTWIRWWFVATCGYLHVGTGPNANVWCPYRGNIMSDVTTQIEQGPLILLGYLDETGTLWLEEAEGRRPYWRVQLPSSDPLREFWDEFWSRMEVVGECWEWTGKRRHGYGITDGLGMAYRLAFSMAVRPIRPGEVIRHTCDNPPCCRPSHLMAGTRGQNMKDAWARRGFDRSRQAKGEGHPAARLTRVQVEEIRRRVGAGELQKDLAKEFGVSASVVNRIWLGKSWV